MRAGTCVGLLTLMLGSPSALCAAEEAAIERFTWVRVRTGGEVSGDGFAMSSRDTRGKALSHDKATVTFDVNGERLRVARPGRTLEGKVLLLDDRTLALETKEGETPVLIPRPAIIRLDRRERASKRGLGLTVGLIAGGLMGYVIGTATSGPGCRGGETGLAHLCALDELGGPAGLIVGVPIGAVLGAAVAPGARWKHVNGLDHVRMIVAPLPGRGTSLSIALSF